MGVNPMEADNASSLYKGGGGKQTSTQTETPYQQGQYSNLLNKSDAWLKNGGFDKSYGGSADFDPTADFTQGQTQGLQGSQQTGAALAQLYGGAGQSSLADYLGPYDPNKTGLTGAINASNNQLDFNYGTQVAPQVRQGATDAGQYGSTRHGVAEGLALSQLSQQKLNAANTMAFQDQQAYNQNRLGVLGNLSTITKGLNSGNGLQYDAGALQQGQNQNEINGALQKWAYENNADLNDLLAYQQLISGNYGGTTTGVSKGGGGGGSGALGAIGTIGGAIVGGMFGAPTVGAAAGGAIGNSLS
jgi:hypothetical protein